MSVDIGGCTWCRLGRVLKTKADGKTLFVCNGCTYREVVQHPVQNIEEAD